MPEPFRQSLGKFVFSQIVTLFSGILCAGAASIGYVLPVSRELVNFMFGVGAVLTFIPIVTLGFITQDDDAW